MQRIREQNGDCRSQYQPAIFSVLIPTPSRIPLLPVRDFALAWLAWNKSSCSMASPASARYHCPRIALTQNADSCEVHASGKPGREYGHPSVRLTQRNSNLPPEKRRGHDRGVVWRAYKWPSRGDVLSSGRRCNNQIIEVLYTLLAYLIVAPLAFVLWLIQIAHRTNRSQPTNKNTIPIRR